MTVAVATAVATLAAAARAAAAALADYDSGEGAFSALYEANAAVGKAAVALGAGINAADNEDTLDSVAAVLAAGGIGGRPSLAAALAALGEAGRIDRPRAVEVICNPAAFAWVMADLPVKLAGAVAGRISDPQAKVSIRYVDQYNIQTDQLPRRMDCIVGAAPILPYFALRAWN